MKSSTLTKLAADLRAELDGRNTRVSQVVGQTFVALERTDARLQLFVGRLYVAPDPADAELIATAFGAPADDYVHVALWVPNQDGEKTYYKALRYSWTEAA